MQSFNKYIDNNTINVIMLLHHWQTIHIILGEYTMAKQKDFEVTTSGSNAIISNIKTYNNKHKTFNTTYAAKATPTKKLEELVATPPSVASIRDAIPHIEDQKLADLEKEVIQNRKMRDAKDLAKHQDFKDEKAELRKKMQYAKESDAKAIVAADYVHRIEVTVHNNSNSGSIKLNIDVLQEVGGFFQKFTAKCQNRRARDIMQSVPPKYKDWEGYEYAKEAIRDGANAGKITLRQNKKKYTQIAMKVIPKAVAVFNPDTHSVEILLGDNTFEVELEPVTKTSVAKYYAFKGILQNEKPEEWMD